MSEGNFVHEESIGTKVSAWSANRRFLLSLPLFLKFLPLSLLCILLASVLPSVFRWYAGTFAESAGTHAVPYFGWKIPVTMTGLIGVALLGTFFRICAWASFELSGMWSAQRLHAAMVEGLARARTTFFDENPSGRIINRLIRDYDEVRSTAIIFIGDVLNAITEILSVSILAMVVSPWAALMVFPLFFSFSYMQWQRTGMIDHARSLAAISTSQVLDRKTDLVEGRELFLLYGRADRLMARMGASYRRYIQASALTFLVETWASFWIRIAAEVFSIAVLVLLVLMLADGDLDVTFAGVIISSLFGIRGSIGWLDHATSFLGRSLPHLRRVFEFIDLPAEESEEKAAPAARAITFPFRAGDVRFERYTMSYRKDTPVILRDLDLTLPQGTKTALIGRTGSGKTSLVQALFRMVHVHAGDIRMGERSLFDADIHAVRSMFGVVPQAPYLFAGDLRSNLDRFGIIGTRELENALEAVGLRFRLDHPVQEGGQNFSVGERQLICLARVIAADRPFILMDEPTSGLDPGTDVRVSRILRTALAGRTVLTIAHRRESLGSYDRVIEMSQGRIIWDGTPAELERR